MPATTIGSLMQLSPHMLPKPSWLIAAGRDHLNHFPHPPRDPKTTSGTNHCLRRYSFLRYRRSPDLRFLPTTRSETTVAFIYRSIDTLPFYIPRDRTWTVIFSSCYARVWHVWRGAFGWIQWCRWENFSLPRILPVVRTRERNRSDYGACQTIGPVGLSRFRFSFGVSGAGWINTAMAVKKAA